MTRIQSKPSIGALALVFRASTMMVAVANVVVIARLLGPADSGRYFLFVSAVLVLATMAELGLSQSAAVFPSRYPEHLAEIHGVLLRCTGLCSMGVLAVGIAVFLIADDSLLPSLPTVWLGLIAAAVPPALYANLWNNMAIGSARVLMAAAVQLGTTTLTLIFNALWLAAFGGQALTVVVVYVLVQFTQAAIMLRLARQFAGYVPGQAQVPALTYEMVTFGIHGYPGAISTFLWMRATLFLLDIFHGSSAVGIFSIAQQVAEKVLLPAQIIKEVIYREISSLARPEATAQMNRYLRLTLVILAPITLITAWIAPRIIGGLFGEQFATAAPIFQILFVGSVAMIVPTLLAPYFLGQLGRPGLLSLLSWSGVIMNGIMALWLVPAYAEIGAAIALVSTQLFGTCLLLSLYLRYGRTDVRTAMLVGSDDLGRVIRQLGHLIRSTGS